MGGCGAVSGALFRRRSADAFRPISASGGVETTITVSGRQFRVHSFTSVGTSSFVVTDPGSEAQIEWMCIAGGGGAGQGLWGGGGGGGGGGMLEGVSTVTARSYAVTVGIGGRGQEQPGTTRRSGGPSSIQNIVSTVGGGAGQRTTGLDGGSGAGGGAGDPSTAAAGAAANDPGTGIPGQGHDGGFGLFQSTGVRGAGGGGGAQEPGQDASATKAGDGAPGRESSIRTGSVVRYGAGGGGGHRGTAPGAGGTGGGGAGGASDSNGGDATGFGNGGGGGSSGSGTSRPGGNGSSGIVVIRYPLERA